MRAAVAFLRERLAEPVTLADLAGEVHLSVYHLVRVFRAATGRSSGTSAPARRPTAIPDRHTAIPRLGRAPHRS